MNVADTRRIGRKVERQGSRVARLRGRGLRATDLPELRRLRTLLAHWTRLLSVSETPEDTERAKINRHFLRGDLATEIARLERA